MDLKDTIIKQLAAPVKRKGTQDYMTDEEDIFDKLDSLNPKNIIKYLDMRGIPHREPANITVKVKPDASGLKLRHSLKRVATELKNARNNGKNDTISRRTAGTQRTDRG